MLFIGPMSKNVVDAAIELSNENSQYKITFIPSRRQIEFCGGYVNNWTTVDFCKYVKSRNASIKIERDHGGPGQGSFDDDGYYSLAEDCKYMDLIHIDPWKRYKNIDDAIQWTIDMILYCHRLNPNIEYEIGTEESIRSITHEELEIFVARIKESIDSNVFNKIKYLVIQCGTGLCAGKNVGTFDHNRLKNMLDIADKYGMTAKEHNGDWVPNATKVEKYNRGLNCINVAPELGELETRILLNHIRDNSEDFENWFNLCYHSNKWKKWVSDDFNPLENKEELILISGHYVFAMPEFVKIKNKYHNIDYEILSVIKKQLTNYVKLQKIELYNTRTECIFCKNSSLTCLFEPDLTTHLSMSFIDNPTTRDQYFIPFNVQLCNECNSYQIKYTGNPSMLYEINHIDTHGRIKSKMHNHFSSFISDNKDIKGILEIGACTDFLARLTVDSIQCEYYIIDPGFIGRTDGLHIINDFVENVDIASLPIDTVVMSSVFEHIYDPINLLKLFKSSHNIKRVILNHPNFDYDVKNNVYTILNVEHTFYIEHQYLINLFRKFSFELVRQDSFDTHCVQFEFVRSNNILEQLPGININSKSDVSYYFNRINRTTELINTYMNIRKNDKFFLWPASAHSTALITGGLNYKRLEGLLDNSPNKIGKYLYGYGLQCFPYNTTVEEDSKNTHIIICGAGSYTNELIINVKNISIIDINLDSHLHKIEQLIKNE